MRFFFYFPLCCSFLALLPYALEVSDFQFFPTDGSIEDFFPPAESFDDTLAWDRTFDELSDSSILLASDCSGFSLSINRKRLRRGDSPDSCNANNPPTGSTANGGQDNGNEHSGSGSNDDTVGSNDPLGDVFSLPALAPYEHDRHYDCLRFTQGQLPLAVCDLTSGSGTGYIIDGVGYRDLEYSYPGKERHHFLIYPSLLASISSQFIFFWSFWLFTRGSSTSIHMLCWLVPYNAPKCPYSPMYCCATFDGIASATKCRPFELLKGGKLQG